MLGLTTAGLPTDTTLHQAAGIDVRTADAYDRLLESLYLLDRVPAWTSNRLVRLGKRPKRNLVDPAFAMSAARIDADEVLEVDLVVDLGGGRVIGIEVEAGAAPGPRDARHLAWMRDQLGERFVRGVVLHTGPQPFELGDRLWALPIWALWSA